MSDEDLASIVVYIRTLPPARHELPRTDVIFPVKYLINSAPQPITQPVAAPDSGDLVKRGEYLVTIAGCAGCHTPAERGKVIPGMDFAGGNYFSARGVAAASANLTPDASGIGYYDENLFMQVVRTGVVRARKLAPIMPFSGYKNLTDDDLKAMFAYLRTVKAVKHRVDNSLPPTLCRLCRQKHGAGDQN
jgi:mono/diheme cytochrome c family protein